MSSMSLLSLCVTTRPFMPIPPAVAPRVKHIYVIHLIALSVATCPYMPHPRSRVWSRVGPRSPSRHRTLGGRGRGCRREMLQGEGIVKSMGRRAKDGMDKGAGCVGPPICNPIGIAHSQTQSFAASPQHAIPSPFTSLSPCLGVCSRRRIAWACLRSSSPSSTTCSACPRPRGP